VPREHFVDASQQASAYEDRPLPIGTGQTISQPYIVARMCELALAGRDKLGRVLEIGAGSGYASAVLGRLSTVVYALEIVPELAGLAQRKISSLMGARNITIARGDGSLGWSEHAPYDAILVAAGAPRIPGLLLTQLSERGGRLVIPVGERDDQRLVVVERNGDSFDVRPDTPVRFVDLTGRYGWGGDGPPQA
jgi:protein-L-isoaspartate(D-aspartate) O-methyltransferase